MYDPANGRPLLLGHRGCRLKNLDENSIPAFECALASGCDGFEFDVRVTADDRLVCVHDEAVKRQAVHSTHYDQLCKLYLKSCRDASLTSIAELEPVLEHFGSRAFLDIELKVAGMETAVARLLEGLNPATYVVTSFLPEVLRKLAELAPTAPLGYLARRLDLLRIWPELPCQYVLPRHDIVSREIIRDVHAAGRKLVTWTVNRRDNMLRLADWGVDGLISDDPKLLSDTLAGRD